MNRYRVRLSPGEWLFRQGDAGDCAYIVESGEIEIRAGGASGDSVVARLGAQDVLGEMALAGESVRSAGAMASVATELTVISPDYLGERLRHADPLLRHLLRTITNRCRGMLDERYGRVPRSDSAGPAAVDAGRADREHAYAQLRTEQELEQALEKDQLALFYQPIVSCADTVPSGFEALIRWPQPDGSFVSPLQFIPLAESSGLIVPMGRWIAEKACTALAEFSRAAGRRVSCSINLSATQFGDETLLPTIERALAGNGLEPSQLTLEVTESLMIERLDDAVAFLNRCRAIGLKVSVDDFGTGHSSLSYLHLLPADILKLDRSFVLNLETGEAAFRIARAITALAHELGLGVIQEGVETAAQVALVKALGVDRIQGYFYSKPLPKPAAVAYIGRDTQTPTASAAAAVMGESAGLNRSGPDPASVALSI